MPSVGSLLDSNYTENSANGIVEYQYSETYIVIASSTSEGPDTIANAAGIPQINSSKLIGSTGTYVWCFSRHPQRVGLGADRLKWHVTCQFTNLTSKFERDENGDPVDDPLAIVPRVDFAFQENYAPITSATFQDLVDKNGASTSTKPYWMTPGLVTNYLFNSAGDKVPGERRVSQKTITIRKIVRNWNNAWDNALNTVNSGSLTITQRDTDGIRLAQTYTARQLLLIDVLKQDVWKQGKLYFDVGFVLEYKPLTWRHIEPDAGTRRFLHVGQYKEDGTTWTAGDFDNPPFRDKWQEIVTYDDDGNIIGLIGDPVPLNGYGMEIPIRNADISTTTKGQSYSLLFDIYSETNFSALGIV